MEHNLWTLFDAVAASVPQRDAVVSRGRRLAYSGLADRSRRVGHVLASHGLGRHVARADLEPWESRQDVAGFYLLNGPEYLEVTLGAYAAGAAPANVNYRDVAEELAYLLEDASAGAVIYHARFAPTLEEVRARPLVSHSCCRSTTAPGRSCCPARSTTSRRCGTRPLVRSTRSDLRAAEA